MPQPYKLTDAQLKQLYFGIAEHYMECNQRTPRPSIGEVYNELYNTLYYYLNDPMSPSTLSHLDPAEKQKAYTVLNTFFYACPQFQVAPPPQAATFFHYGTPPPPTVIVYNYTNRHYSSNNDFLFTWLLLSSLNRPYHPHHGGYFPAGQHHGHHHQNNNKKDKDKVASEAIALLILIALAVAAFALTFVALYYLLRETLDSIERFSYNEGWLQAGFSLLSMAAGGAAAAMLSMAFLATPLAGLALAAGLANPAGVVIIGIVCLSIIGAAAGCFITDQIQNYFIKKSNVDALDPVDPHRFALTDTEADNLRMKGIDPVKVKCAIVALRAQIGDKPVPSLLNRFCCSSRGQEIQESLDKVRKLRSGEIYMVDVGDMKFNCRQTLQPVYPLQPLIPQAQPLYPAPPPIPQMYAGGAHPNAFYGATAPQHEAPYDIPPPYTLDYSQPAFNPAYEPSAPPAEPWM